MKIEAVETNSTLFKLDSKGKVRVWYMQLGATEDQSVWAHRAVAGLQDGEHAVNEWKVAKPKNVGKANETTSETQARQEIESLYTKKRDTGYSDTIEAVETHEYFKPMLAETYGKKGLTGNISQPKFDGMRSVWKADGAWSRTGNPIHTVPHIKSALSRFFERYPEAVVDGELYSHEHHDKFEKLMSLLRKENASEEQMAEIKTYVKLYFYDGYLTEADKNKTFRKRYDALADAISDFFGEDSVPLERVGYLVCETQAELDEAYGRCMEDSYEGQIVRTDDLPYEHKRSKSVLKRKEFETAEFVIEGVIEGEGNWSGCAKRLTIKNPNFDANQPESDTNKKTFGSGMRGSQNHLKTVLEDHISGNRTPKWATLRFFGYSAYGVPRFPVAIDWGYTEERND